MRPSRRAALVLALALTPSLAGGAPLDGLARELVGAGQGVFVQADDGTVLAAQAERRPVHPASVTKIATTLALLERLGPDHRFVTRLRADGPVRDGTLAGDLVVAADGDPFLVDESAARMLARLHALGVRHVTGGVAVHGHLLFDWRPDPEGRALRAALAGRIPADAWATGAGGGSVATEAIRFDGREAAGGSAQPLVTYRSPPLRTIVKALNGYSNNVFHPLSDAVGGPHAVQAIARAELPADVAPDEVVIDNGAGAETTNRLSPRAAVAILAALGRTLARVGLDYPDVLPVSGMDAGTLAARLDGDGLRAAVVGKTGTYGDVGASALVGVLRTRAHGRVRFAILNAWVPVPEARRRQDAFVRALAAAEGAEPWPYVPDARPPISAASID
jgi:D-alanyl-D-alanine carboxypeptidase/D-alanyl-D-alanine-endopeptidase (penicillin-binding protein 4)